jgi:hypothetical protein
VAWHEDDSATGWHTASHIRTRTTLVNEFRS